MGGGVSKCSDVEGFTLADGFDIDEEASATASTVESCFGTVHGAEIGD